MNRGSAAATDRAAKERDEEQIEREPLSCFTTPLYKHSAAATSEFFKLKTEEPTIRDLLGIVPMRINKKLAA